MKKILLFMILSSLSFGVNLDFGDGGSRRIQLLDGGRVRISERFKWEDPAKEVILKDFPEDIRRESLVVENEDIGDTVFSIRKTDKKSIEEQYRGREVIYNNEKYTLLSLTPLIIERKRDGRVVINPPSQIEMEPVEESVQRNSVRIIGENPMKELSLSYEYESLKWQKIHNLNLDRRFLEDMVIFKNSGERILRDMELTYGRQGKFNLSLEPQVEKKVELAKKDIEVEKYYSYISSEGVDHPELNLKVTGAKLSEGSSVRVIEGGRYIGSMVARENDESLEFEGIVEERVDIKTDTKELRFGEKLRRRSVEISIKNYRSDIALVSVVYDELPKRWYEMKSDLPYEITKEGIVFNVPVGANSRKNLKFSYIMEKI